MTALLTGIGIEKGREFNPDAETEKAMLEGSQRAYDSMQDYFINRSTIPWWENRQWQVWQFAKGQPDAGLPYVDENQILIDERAGVPTSGLPTFRKRLEARPLTSPACATATATS